MSITIRALLQMSTKGIKPAAGDVARINKELEEANIELEKAADNAERMRQSLAKTKTGQTAMARAGIVQDYRTQRSVTGSRGAEGRDFAGLAQGGGGQGFVAAYATLAANLFAVTAAFQALNNAAKTEQLTQGLELMGARSGVPLKLVAKNLREITDNAISSADAMRAVAQASSAGMSSTEMERLAKVARGASLALGRDVTDSMDRLTRGVTKLEPELLDEIGIMVRLDDAVALYAKQNNVAASSLTNLQRRQAFANAVLDEGERKFGAINTQIDSNPYAKLAGALKDLGTQFANIANNVLIPFVELVTKVPIIGLVPALGVLSQALSKVMPNLDSFYAQIEGRRDRLLVRQDFVSSLIPEAEATYYGAARGSQEETEALKEINRLRKEDINLQARINVESRQALIIGTFQENMRRRGIRYALQELAAQQAILNVEYKRLGINQQITLLTKARAIWTAASGAVTMLFSALSTVLMVVTLIAAAVGLAVAAFQHFFPPTEAEERLKKYKEEMKELLASAKETRNQLQYLTAGEGQDALVNSSLAIIDNLKKQKKEQEDIAEVKNKALTVSQQEQALVREVVMAKQSASLIQGRSQQIAADNALAAAKANLEAARGAKDFLTVYEKLPEEAQVLYATLQDVLPEQAKIVRTAMEEGKSREYVIDLLLKQEDSLKKIQNFNANLSTSAKTIVEEWDKLKLKDLDTGFTKINESFQDISKVISQLEKPLSIRSNTAIFDQLKAIGSDKLLATLATAKDLNVKINPSDEAKIKAFIDNLKSIQELEIKIKTSTGMEKVFAQLELKAREVFGIGIGAQIADDMAETAQKAEDILVANLINEKIAGNIAAINSANLEIETKRLDMARKRADAENDIIGVSIKEDSLIKSIVDSSRLLEDTVMARKKASNDILALEKNQSTLILQKNAAKEGSNEYKMADAQITANNALLAVKKQQAELDVEAAQEAFDISIRKTASLANNVKLAQQETTLLDGSTKITAELLSAENARLAVKDKQLAREKEIFDLNSRLIAATLSADRQVAEAAAAKRGGTVSGQQERDFAIREADERIRLIEEEKISLKKEEENAASRMKLENEILKFRMNAAKLELENAIATAEGINATARAAGKTAPISSASISTAKDSLKSFEGIDKLLKEQYDKEIVALTEIFGLKQQILDQDLRGAQAARSGISGSAQEEAGRIIAGLSNRLATTIGGFGLTGQGADFYASERAGVLNRTQPGSNERKEELKNLKAISFEIQQQQILTEGLNGIFDNLSSGIEGAFMAMIDGSKSAKQAFGEMAIAILKDIAAMTIRMLIFKAIQSGLNFLSPPTPMAAKVGYGYTDMRGVYANGGIIALANGGIMDARGGLQGIVSKPTYLVGEGRYNEAVVPLPNGKSIPVQMHGGSSQSNNVAVTVNMSNSGSQTQTEGQDPAKLGQAIAAAVQRELVAQKAPGGLLNRYSAI